MTVAKTFLSGFLLLALAACSGAGKQIGSVPGTTPPPPGETPNIKNSVPGSGPAWGSESSASAPAMPYIPADPFEYKCEISLRADSYPADFSAPSEAWMSSSVIVIDNKTTAFSGADIKWAHFYRKREKGVSAPFSQLTTPPPYSLDASFMLNFSYPDDKGVTPVGLSIWMTVQSDANVSQTIVNRSNVGLLSDKIIETSLNYSNQDKQANLYKSLVAKMSCERIK